MRKTLSTAAAIALAISGLGVVVAPAEAANKRACVTEGEYRALKVGASKAATTKLLDGKGSKANGQTRRYTWCGSQSRVYVTFDRKFAKKKAKVASFRTDRPAVRPPVVVPVKPTVVAPVRPTVVAPVEPPVEPPVVVPIVTPTTPATPVVLPRPAAVTERQSLVDTSTCQKLMVAVRDQQRTNSWRLEGSAWVADWSPWTTLTTATRAATAKDCVNVVAVPSSDVLLPDIRIKNLNGCGQYDLDVTNGTCFMIVDPAPYEHDFPKLEGRKLLKFPVVTLNVGAGPSEVIADRTGATVAGWKAYQTFYRPNGERQSRVIPQVEFYYAGDGHDHWHFKDFDSYWIESLTGEVVRTAEKHGYCIQDNTLWNGLDGGPGVPTAPVYAPSTSCGAGLPNALTFIQGLSRGWGDTYDTSLPDQAIDITDLPDGRYRVGITADALGAIRESDETNNTATMEISILDNQVTTYPSTATGGLD